MPDLLTLLRDRGLPCRKVSSAHGGEYAGPCPLCGGTDRFHVWPDKRSDSGISPPGRWWCRQCGASGDLIAYLMQVDGLTFGDACGVLGIDRPARPAPSAYRPLPAPRETGLEWSPRDYGAGVEQWRAVAEQFLAAAQERLAHDPEAQGWLERRGIPPRWAAEYGLGYYESRRGGDGYAARASWGLQPEMRDGKPKRVWLPRGWVIPSRGESGELLQLRIRRRDDDRVRFAADVKYLPLAGSTQSTLVLHPEAQVFVVVESGFDAILLARLFGGRIGAVCPWNASARPDARVDALLERALCVLLALDYDAAGESACEWWRHRYRRAVRLPALPGGAKDPGDAYGKGTDLYAWLRDGMPSGLAARLGILPPPPATVRESVPAESPAVAAPAPEIEPAPVPVREANQQGPLHEGAGRAAAGGVPAPASDPAAEFVALLDAEHGWLECSRAGDAISCRWPTRYMREDGQATRARAMELFFREPVSGLAEHLRVILCEWARNDTGLMSDAARWICADGIKRVGPDGLREYWGLEAPEARAA